MKSQIIKLKINDILFTVVFFQHKETIDVSIFRNKKILKCTTAPKNYKYNIKMDIARELSEMISWEISHELEKIEIK